LAKDKALNKDVNKHVDTAVNKNVDTASQSPLAVALSQVDFAWPGQPRVLSDLTLSVPTAERVFLFGPSGSGKSTLLGILGAVQLPQRGSACVLGQDLARLSAAQRDRFRADHIGFVFQQFNLLPYLSLQENVLLGCRFSTRRASRASAANGSLPAHAGALLTALGLGQLDPGRKVHALSVGQQQRVAVARALAGQPELLICDEPTSALDEDTRNAFLTLLFEQCTAARSTLIFVSHERSLASRFDRSLSLTDLQAASGSGA